MTACRLCTCMLVICNHHHDTSVSFYCIYYTYMDHGGYRYQLVLTNNFKKGGADIITSSRQNAGDLSTKGLYALKLLSLDTKKKPG